MAFHPLIPILSPYLHFIPLSAYYPRIRILSPASAFYPLIRIISPHSHLPSPSAIRVLSLTLDGKLYEQTDGVAMGSPLGGPSMANTFMCSIEEKLDNNMDMPSFYHRFVDDTITSQRSLRVLKGGSYSHFPAQILTKSHCPRAQIPSSQWLSCSNLNPIPIFYCFFADESQSQCMKSHFPTQKISKSQFPFYLFRTL